MAVAAFCVQQGPHLWLRKQLVGYVLQRDGVTIELTSGNYDERTIRNAILAAHPASGIELWRLGPTPGGLTWLVG